MSAITFSPLSAQPANVAPMGSLGLLVSVALTRIGLGAYLERSPLREALAGFQDIPLYAWVVSDTDEMDALSGEPRPFEITESEESHRSLVEWWTKTGQDADAVALADFLKLRAARAMHARRERTRASLRACDFGVFDGCLFLRTDEPTLVATLVAFEILCGLFTDDVAQLAAILAQVADVARGSARVRAVAQKSRRPLDMSTPAAARAMDIAVEEYARLPGGRRPYFILRGIPYTHIVDVIMDDMYSALTLLATEMARQHAAGALRYVDKASLKLVSDLILKKELLLVEMSPLEESMETAMGYVYVANLAAHVDSPAFRASYVAIYVQGRTTMGADARMLSVRALLLVLLHELAHLVQPHDEVLAFQREQATARSPNKKGAHGIGFLRANAELFNMAVECGLIAAAEVGQTRIDFAIVSGRKAKRALQPPEEYMDLAATQASMESRRGFKRVLPRDEDSTLPGESSESSESSESGESGDSDADAEEPQYQPVKFLPFIKK